MLPYECSYKDDQYGMTVPYDPLIMKTNLVKPGVKITDRREYAKSTYDHDCRNFVNLPIVELTKDEANMFICGQELRKETSFTNKTEVKMSYHGLILGYGRIVNGRIKNLLPKGLYSSNIRI